VEGKNDGPTTTKGEKREVGRTEGWGGKGRGRDLPDQCHTASYAPATNSVEAL